MIVVVDYGLGNVQAIANIYKRLNSVVEISSSPGVLSRAAKLVLPGVGAFDWAMEKLERSGLRSVLEDRVLGAGVPVLGICVGMQMLARRSEEGQRPGLGWIDAEVRRFGGTPSTQGLLLPHMGWNDVRPAATDSLFRGLESGARFYFLHSYFVAPANPADRLATTTYGDDFASSVRSGCIFGVQFHPEKSHDWGVTLLRNFAEL